MCECWLHTRVTDQFLEQHCHPQSSPKQEYLRGKAFFTSHNKWQKSLLYKKIASIHHPCCLFLAVTCLQKIISIPQVSPSRASRWMLWTRWCWTCRMKCSRAGSLEIRLWWRAPTTPCTRQRNSPCCPAPTAPTGKFGYKVRERGTRSLWSLQNMKKNKKINKIKID